MLSEQLRSCHFLKGISCYEDKVNKKDDVITVKILSLARSFYVKVKRCMIMSIVPGDCKAFATGIIKLLVHDEERKRAAMSSIEVVSNGYSIEAHLKLIKATYEQLT